MLRLSCEVVQKGGFWVTDLQRGLQTLDMCFQIVVTSEHMANIGLVPFTELGD